MNLCGCRFWRDGLLITGVSALLSASALGQRAPASAPLPNFDSRQRVGAAAFRANAAEAQAELDLQSRVPGVVVNRDSVVKTPRFIYRPGGFLTTAGGIGGAVSAEALRAVPVTEDHRVVKAFLSQHAQLFGHGAEVLDSASVARDSTSAHNGMRTVIWQQQVDGLPVFGGTLIAHTTKRGELVSICSRLLPDAKGAADAGTPNRDAAVASPAISAEQAISIAAQNLGATVAADALTSPANKLANGYHTRRVTGLRGDVYHRQVWLPLDQQTLRLSWEVILSARTRPETYRLLIDATTGAVLSRHCMTQYLTDATYRVYTSDSPSPFSPGFSSPTNAQPPLVNRQSLTFAAISTNASPEGWIPDGGNETLGNNADAHTDLDDDDEPDQPRPKGQPARTFNFPLDLTLSPLTYSRATVVQLFYWNNFMHDKLYDLGFTEAAGNFQTDNFARGGEEEDPVLADAQDGGGVDNANFLTLPDGIPGRMQMYLFTGPEPDRDGSLDAEIVLHEYTHGLSNRLVGGGLLISELQTAGMGEGWSDFYALALLGEDGDNINGVYAEGGYATYLIFEDFFPGFNFTVNYYFGIRRYPYSTDMSKAPLTFKDIDPDQIDPHAGVPLSPLFEGYDPTDPIFGASEVHNQGEVWCSALWEVRANLISRYGFSVGNQLALQLVTDGMILSPVDPNFLEARDAILLADAVDTGGANYLDIWSGFAKRGMGYSAQSPGSFTTTGVIESFDLPGPTIEAYSIDDANENGGLDPNECSGITIYLRNLGAADATGVSARLSSISPEAAVTVSRADYPDIPVGGIGTNSTPFQVSTTPGLSCGQFLSLQLIVQSTLGRATLPLTIRTGTGGQRFDNNTPLPLSDFNNGPSSNVSAIAVGAVSNVTKVVVSFYLTHTFDSDLEIFVTAPNGKTAVLVDQLGGEGDNYGLSCSPVSFRAAFDDEAPSSVSNAVPPFVGTFRPQDDLAPLLEGGAAGIWKLTIMDKAPGDVGELECWSVEFPGCEDGGGECRAPDLSTYWGVFGHRANSQTVRGRVFVRNTGNQKAESFVMRVYLSSDAFVSANDYVLFETVVSDVPARGFRGFSFTTTVPRTIPVAGKFGIARADALDAVDERNEFNNDTVTGALQ